MHIVICGSIAHYHKMQEVKAQLEQLGHTTVIPPHEVVDEKGNVMDVQSYHTLRHANMHQIDSWIWKRKNQLMTAYFDKIQKADSIIVVNEEKNNIQGYVGANTLLEMGIALHFNKKIFLLNPIPEISYKEEILACQPLVINGNLQLVV